MAAKNAGALVMLVLASVAWPMIAAAMPDGSASHAITVWETDDGLPHNSVTGVVQRRDGFLWIATQGGLVRFDGLEFNNVASPLIHGVRSSGVGALVEEDAETLLLATLQSGLLRFRGGIATEHPLNPQIGPNRKIAHLFRETDGIFWVIFSDREAWRWRGGKVERFEAPPDLRSFWPASFARDAEGRVFLSRGAGVERYVDGALSLVEGSPQTAVTIGSAHDDGIWVATSRQIVRFTGDWSASIESIPWSGNVPPAVLHEDRQGALWLAHHEQGLVRWKDGAAAPVEVSHVKIFDLAEDAEGNLWVATGGGGLNRVQRTRMTLVAAEADWTDTVSGAVCEDSEGQIWFANRKAVRRLGGDSIEVVSNLPGWSRRALPICPDAAGHLWFGVGPDLFRGRIGDTHPPVLIEQRGSGAIHVIFPARDGSIWVGRNIGPLRRFGADGATESFGEERGYLGRNVRAIGEDADGHLWVGTEDGRLFELHDGRFVEWQPSEGLPGHGIRALHGDEEGALWIGTAGGGLLVRHEGRLARLSVREGLPDEVISQILEDDFGWLWFGSRRGIFKVRKNDLLECARGLRPDVVPVLFGRADGISGISAAGSYQPTAWKTREGRLWFVTRKGLVTTDPAEHQGVRPPVSVYLDRLAADGRTVSEAETQLRSSVRKLEFTFTAPTYTAPERVRFRHRLEGFDADWVDAGTRRFAAYPSLPPGRYRFSVSASTDGLVWSPVAAVREFAVLPRWWETWWAGSLGAGGAILLLAGLVRRLSHRRLKARLFRLEQEQRVERERIRIARDLHDDLGASLTHASMMADELAEDWTEMSDPKERSLQLACRVRAITRDLDAVVWTVSPRHDCLSSLSAYLTDYAAEYFRDSSIECRAHTVGGIPAVPLSPEVRHHLFLIARELLNNVLKHSRAQRVEVSLRMIGRLFELSVSDDGCGFSLAEAERSGRNGLRNLRTRAREVGGHLQWEGGTGGTVATLRLPLPADARLPSTSITVPNLPPCASV